MGTAPRRVLVPAARLPPFHTGRGAQAAARARRGCAGSLPEAQPARPRASSKTDSNELRHRRALPSPLTVFLSASLQG